ncbi:MAG TPA: hypothetical protein VGC29_01965 [Flavisolibacter sp.]
MKFIYIAIILLAVGSVSCKKDLESQQTMVELNQCSEKTFGSETVKICYEAIVEDSRCPANANCAWQGVAKARFTIEVNGTGKTIELSTLTLKPQYQNKISALGYDFRLINLHPYPGTGGGQDQAEIEISK